MVPGVLRPTTTLFLIQSVDGKITTGDGDELDTNVGPA